MRLLVPAPNIGLQPSLRGESVSAAAEGVR